MTKVPRQPEAEARNEVTPLVAPPQPMSRAVMIILKQVTRDWVAAGGTPIP